MYYLPYADADFFIALMRPDDRLNRSAIEIYKKYKNDIYTSLAVVIEILLIIKRFKINASEAIDYLLKIAKVKDVEIGTILLAIVYMEEQKLSIFDAFHAALCDNEIISSDHIYDKIGIKRIVL